MAGQPIETRQLFIYTRPETPSVTLYKRLPIKLHAIIYTLYIL